MARFDRNSRDSGLALKQQIEALSPQERDALRGQAQEEAQRRGLQGFLGGQANIFSQLAGVQPQEEAGISDLDKLILQNELKRRDAEEDFNRKVKLEEIKAGLKPEKEIKPPTAAKGFKQTAVVEGTPVKVKPFFQTPDKSEDILLELEDLKESGASIDELKQHISERGRHPEEAIFTKSLTPPEPTPFQRFIKRFK